MNKKMSKKKKEQKSLIQQDKNNNYGIKEICGVKFILNCSHGYAEDGEVVGESVES